MAAHERYPNAEADTHWCRQSYLLPARTRARELRKRHPPKEVLKGGRGKNVARINLAENLARKATR
jgi:hypothetical protein